METLPIIFICFNHKKGGYRTLLPCDPNRLTFDHKQTNYFATADIEATLCTHIHTHTQKTHKHTWMRQTLWNDLKNNELIFKTDEKWSNYHRDQTSALWPKLDRLWTNYLWKICQVLKHFLVSGQILLIFKSKAFL